MAGNIELNEPVLPDHYPVYGDYAYVADGKVIRSDWHGITVGELKRRLPAEEVRRCDLPQREANGLDPFAARG